MKCSVLTICLLASIPCIFADKTATLRGLQQSIGTPVSVHAADDDLTDLEELSTNAQADLKCEGRSKGERTGMWFPVFDPNKPDTKTNRRFPCSSLARNPRKALQDKDCTCQEYYHDGQLHAKWQPENKDEQTMKIQSLANIIGHAKMLCKIVRSTDCFFEGVKGQTTTVGADGFDGTPEFMKIHVDGQTKFAAKSDIIDTVKTICDVVDGGIGELPKLLPGLIGAIVGNLPGIPGLLGKLIPGLVRGIGGLIGGGSFGDFVDNLFSGIFTSSSPLNVGASRADSSRWDTPILLYASPPGDQR